MRIQYRYPKLYDFLISFLYSKELMDEISKAVGKNQSVLDVAAGYGRMSKFIDPSNSYRGIDINKEFIRHGQSLGPDLSIGDIFDPASYKQSDVILVIDVVHHIVPEKLNKLFDIIFSYANKKVIVVEPAFVEITRKYGLAGNIIGWFFSKMDDDGVNKIGRWFTNEEYKKIFEGRFKSKAGDRFLLSCQIISKHHLAVFYSNSS